MSAKFEDAMEEMKMRLGHMETQFMVDGLALHRNDQTLNGRINWRKDEILDLKEAASNAELQYMALHTMVGVERGYRCYCGCKSEVTREAAG